MSDALQQAFRAAQKARSGGCLECGGVRRDGKLVYMSSKTQAELPRCSTCGAYVHPRDGTALGQLSPDGYPMLKLIIWRGPVPEGATFELL